jgi:hypothetical protein
LLQPDFEILVLGARAVIGKIEAFGDEGVEIDQPALTGTFPRMLAAAHRTTITLREGRWKDVPKL